MAVNSTKIPIIEQASSAEEFFLLAQMETICHSIYENDYHDINRASLRPELQQCYDAAMTRRNQGLRVCRHDG